MKVLVTGATGFLGSAVVRDLTLRGHEVRAAVRSRSPGLAVDQTVVHDVGPQTDWTKALAGVDAVLHLAARVHNLRDDPRNADQYFLVNTLGTINLAEAAVRAGVRRLVFVSTIKVNGEATRENPFRSDDPPCPHDSYGRSKLEAELGLKKVNRLESVIVRPPLIYGPGAKGNLARLCRLASMGLPMPIGAIANRRDLIGVENLADLLGQCLTHPAAANQMFLASDGESVSTQDLYRMICSGLGKRARIVSVPVSFLKLVSIPFGLSDEIGRLSESLQIDSRPTRTMLGWVPPYSTVDRIAAMARAWAADRR